MTPSRVAGGLTQSSSNSGIFYQGEGQSQNVVNSHLSSSFDNSSSTVPGAGRSNLGPVSGDMNNVVLNSVANSAPSVGASSLVTDANSALSGGPHLQRSASVNTDSYLRLPASPMSFTSNNISISGSSVMDVSSVVQQSSHHDQNAQQLQQPQGTSSAMSLPASQTGPFKLQMGAQVPGSFIQDPNNISHLSKKPRLDIKQDDMMQQQVIQQQLRRPDSMQFQGRNPQSQAFLQQPQQQQQQQQQQRLRQQQMFQQMPQLHRVHLQQQQQQQMQLRQQQQQQQQVMQPSSAVKRPYESSVSGICARRLMQYLYHQRHRPNDNSIAYWRKFVAEYYSPRAKKRWCLSLYSNVGHHALGVFPQASMDAWRCDLCGSKSGRGFEATYEVLPRLNEIKFGSGVTDELLFLDLPHERRFASGVMMLEYGKAVQESVYEQLRVVHEGQLRIIFTQDLKILSWEFCARRHEELLPRRLVAPQVNQLVQVAKKCQSTIAESGSDGVSQQDIQTNSNMLLTAGGQLAKILEMQSLNELGFSKRHVRCLQISEVVISMKDLMDICAEHKIGAIESLKNYPRLATASKHQMQKMQDMEQLANVQCLPTDRNTLNKLMALNPGLNNHINNSHNMVNRGALSGSAQAALALNNYQNLLLKQNSMNSSPGSLQREGSSFNNSNQSPSSALQGASPALISGSMQNSSVSGFPSPHLPPQQQQHHLQQRSLSSNALLQQNHSHGSQGNQALQQQMIHQLLQEMSNNSGGMQPQSLGGPNANGNIAKNAMGSANIPPSSSGGSANVPPSSSGGSANVPPSSSGGSANVPPSLSGGSANVPGNYGPMSRNNSFKTASNSDSSAVGGNNGFNQRTSEMPQHLQDVVPDIGNEFMDNLFLNSDLDDNMGFGWKA